MAVQIGKYDLTQDDAYDYLLVEEHVIHPNYTNIIQNDFSLAKLYRRSNKPLVSLNTDASSPVDDKYLTVMGWGVTVEGVISTQSEILREVDVQYMSNTDTSWILEANDRGNFIDGTLYVPFGMYDEDNEVAVESLQVVSGFESILLMDC
jgi:hypothetical protein